MDILHIKVSNGTGPPTLHVGGEIDLATAGQFRTALEEALAAEPKLVVEMADVVFIDLSGLRVVTEVAETLNGSGPLRLVNAPLLARLIELVGLQDLRSIAFDDRVTTDG